MTHFVLRQDPFSSLYAVWQDGKKVKNDIFTGIEDFKQELKALEYSQPYTVEIKLANA